jgi:hypothetical protein
MRRHRAQVAHDHQGRGREVSSVDWTLAHHERGPHIVGVDQADDDGQQRTARFQPVVTAVISNRHVIAGLEVVGQEPKARNEERASVEATSKASDEPMEEARKRGLELLHHRQPRLADRKRTALAREIVQPLDEDGPWPQAPDAFDTGVLNLELTRDIESRHQHWGRELACSRHMQWSGQWRRGDVVAAELKPAPPERVRPVTVPCRNGERKPFWARKRSHATFA